MNIYSQLTCPIINEKITDLIRRYKREIKKFKGTLSEKEKEIELLMQNDKVKQDALATLSDQMMKLMIEVQELKEQKSALN